MQGGVRQIDQLPVGLGQDLDRFEMQGRPQLQPQGGPQPLFAQYLDEQGHFEEEQEMPVHDSKSASFGIRPFLYQTSHG